MGIDVAWDDAARTIIRVDFRPGWKLADFDAVVVREYEMLEGVEHNVAVIAHFLPGAEPPVGALSHFRKSMDVAPPQVDLVVVTNSGPFVALLLSVFLRVYRQYADQFWLADSLEDARLRLAERQRV